MSNERRRHFVMRFTGVEELTGLHFHPWDGAVNKEPVLGCEAGTLKCFGVSCDTIKHIALAEFIYREEGHQPIDEEGTCHNVFPAVDMSKLAEATEIYKDDRDDGSKQ